MLLQPDGEDIGELVIGDVRADGDEHRDDERRNDSAVLRRKRSCGLARLPRDPRRQISIATEISGEPAKHEQGGDAETDMPSISFAEEPAYKRTCDGAKVD